MPKFSDQDGTKTTFPGSKTPKVEEVFIQPNERVNNSFFFAFQSLPSTAAIPTLPTDTNPDLWHIY